MIFEFNLVIFWCTQKSIGEQKFWKNPNNLLGAVNKVELSELTISKIAKEISDILGVVPESWF